MCGVIDIGSNTIRLVIYKVKDKSITPMLNKKFSVGLASYINGDKRLKPRGIDKVIEALTDFREILTNVKVNEIFPFATASLRNISNSDEVVGEIKERTGFGVRILSGDEEATFDYFGAVHSVSSDDGMVVDVGGGSTEVVFFENNRTFFSMSYPYGSLNLFNQYVESIIPTKKELDVMKDAVREALESSKLPAHKFACRKMLAVGGSARAVQKFLADTNAPGTDVSEYPAAMLGKLVDMIKKDSASFYKNILKSSADRIHTFTPGLILLDEVAEYCGSQSVITSHYGVREGYLYYLLKERGVL
ncbi:MAG: hypothetical protein ACOYD9_02220 [Pyramidobacter sp.]|jgi:exopolyphosphatase/guanosine-5'-triphosphate,3'-diphosphate pyrophosphatase